MPNWVFNHLYDYDKELFDKYSSDERAIDFNKVIPEPEDIHNTPSGSFNKIAKEIYEYNRFKQEATNDKYFNWKYDTRNPLHDEALNIIRNTQENMGKLAIKNPDESLNQILSKEENSSQKILYDDYISVLGNNDYETYSGQHKDYEKLYDNFRDLKERKFNEFKEVSKNINETVFDNFDSLEGLGAHLKNCEEKYGFDNWYDWRNANWGTKWNACDSEYDEEMQQLNFDTAWAIPYPIITKIAHDNPDKKFSGYSEEETGWFDEYHSNKGRVIIDKQGEYQYDEETDETIEHSEPSGEILEFNSYINKSIDEWKKFSEISVKY